MKMDLLKTYKDARESRGLKEWADIKKLSNHDLLSFFLDFAFVINRKEGEVHFYMLMAAYYISGLFQEMWRTNVRHRAGHRPEFSPAHVGLRVDGRELHPGPLAARKKGGRLGLEEVFKTSEDEDVLEKLKATEKGREWAEAYHAYLLEHGWRADRQHAYDFPTWIEKPSIGIARIKVMMSEPIFPFDAHRDRVVREREEAEKEVLAKVPEGQRAMFGLLMKAAQKAGYWSEDHGYYCDLSYRRHGQMDPHRVRQEVRGGRVHR